VANLADATEKQKVMKFAARVQVEDEQQEHDARGGEDVATTAVLKA